MKKKILFFIGGLNTGGKERRLLELITYLNQTNNFDLVLVTHREEVAFDNFDQLKLEWVTLSTDRLTLISFWEFFQIVKKHRPNIINTWGSKQTFVSLPSKLMLSGLKLVNSQITSAPPKVPFSERLISKINFLFSDVVLSNSYAGLESFKPPRKKSIVIYNGLNKDRFSDLLDKEVVKEQFGLDKPFNLIMVASFSANKDYLRFYETGIALSKLRDDFNFIGVGYYDADDDRYYKQAKELAEQYSFLSIIPGTTEVESLVNACDIGLLFSPNGEGLSNSILEYMALGKPVIASDIGGTKEIVKHSENGFLVNLETPLEIAELINTLLEDSGKMEQMGKKSKKRICDEFSLEAMGKAFEKVFSSLI